MQKKESFYFNTARNLLIFESIKKVLQELSNAGVKVIVLKGAVLAYTVYPTIAERRMGDIDLLVHDVDLEHTRIILEKIGYERVPEPEKSLTPFNINLTGEINFRSNRGEIIDLHWELIPIEWLRKLTSLDMEIFWCNAYPFSVDGIQALQLAPVDSLLHICIHLVSQNYAHAVGFNDIVQIINYHQPFSWDDFISSAKQFKLKTACYFALEVAASELDAMVPAYVLNILRPTSLRCWLVTLIANPREGMHGKLPYSHSRSYLLHLAIADRLVDILRVIIWLLFPGPRWLAERHKLHGIAQSWFACLWHPFFVFWQGIKSILVIMGINKVSKTV